MGEQERNYHIFYQLVKGSNSTKNADLKLHAVENFNILMAGHCTVAGTVDNDAELFSNLCSALVTLGLSPMEMEQLWSVLSCILHMGNISPVAAASEDENHSLHSPTMPLEEIAIRLGVIPADFGNSILFHVVKIERRSSISMKKLTVDEVQNNILGLMKWLYSGVFNWLVRVLNAAYKTTEADTLLINRFIGILDIFGNYSYYLIFIKFIICYMKVKRGCSHFCSVT